MAGPIVAGAAMSVLATTARFIALKIKTNPMLSTAGAIGGGILIEKALDEDDDTKEALDVILGDLDSDDREKMLTLANGIVGEAANIWVDPKIRTGERTAEFFVIPVGENALASGKTPMILNQVFGRTALRRARQRGWNSSNRTTYRKKK
tara:strand:+ start:98 stop:547 length:450 start_codon:yes stop_codon:yes gene_type:complete